jgi:hypothetical protein
MIPQSIGQKKKVEDIYKRERYLKSKPPLFGSIILEPSKRETRLPTISFLSLKGVKNRG